MPFNAGGQTYQGGSYLYGGLSNLGKGVGEGIAGAIQKFDENRRLESYNDTVVQHALSAGQITHEDFDKYLGMSRTQKTGFAAGIASNFLQDYRTEQLKSLKESREAQAAERLARAAESSWTPSQEDIERARWTGNELIQTGPGKYSLAAYGEGAAGEGEPEVKPMLDPSTGKPIPGFGIVTKPGSKQFQVVPFATGGVQIELDPQTGTPFYRDIKGNPHPLTGQQIMAGQMMPDKTAVPEAQGEPGSWDALAGGAMAGDPATVLAQAWKIITRGTKPAAPKQSTGNENAPTTGPEAAPAPAGETAAAKQDKRQQAIQILQSANKPVTEANIQAVIKKLEK